MHYSTITLWIVAFSQELTLFSHSTMQMSVLRFLNSWKSSLFSYIFNIYTWSVVTMHWDAGQELISLYPVGAAWAQWKIGLDEGYFSGKSLKLILSDACISAQNALKCVWRLGFARTRRGAHSAPPDPLAEFTGSYLGVGRGNAPNFVSRFRGIEAPDTGEHRSPISNL